MNHRDSDSLSPDPFGSLSSELQTLSSLADASSYDRWSFPSAMPRPRIDLTREGNEWLHAVRPRARAPASPGHFEGRYRVTPALYSWDLYRVRLLTWRVDTGSAFEAITRRVEEAAPNGGADIFAAELGTDHLAPLRRELFAAEAPRGNFFLVCTPRPFVLRVTFVLSGAPDLLVAINPLLTVSDLKAAIHKARGYPPRRMDLIFDGHVLENAERLFLFGLRDGSCLKLVLQRGLFLPVHIQTFWEQQFDIDLDVTATVAETVSMIVRRCTSPQLEATRLQESFVLPQAITLRTNDGSVLGHLDCVSRGLDPLSAHNFFSVIEDAVTSRQVMLRVDSEIGNEEYVVPGTEASSLVPVFLRLYAITRVPIDLMTLVAPGCTLNPFDTLHTDAHGSKLGLLCRDLQSTMLMHPRHIRVVMPRGSILPVTVSQGAQVSDVKEELVRLGYPSAGDFALSHDDSVLSDHKALHRCSLQDNDFLFLTRSEFPIDVVSLQGKALRVRVQDHSSLEELFAQGDALYDPVRRRSQYIFCGEALSPRRTAGQSDLQPGNMVFQDRRPSDLVLEILFGPDEQPRRAELSLHRHSVAFQLRRLLGPWALTEATLEALEQAVVWRNFPRPATEVLRTREPTETREDGLSGEGVWDLKYGWAFQRPQPPPPGLEDDSAAFLETPSIAFKSSGPLERAEERARRLERLLDIGPKPQQPCISLPPMQLHSSPLHVHYDLDKGLPSLLWTPSADGPRPRRTD